MTEKGEEMRGRKGGRERESMLSFAIWIDEGGKRRKKRNCLDPTFKKEEGFQFQISQGMNGKTGVPGGKKPLDRCSDINLDEGFIGVDEGFIAIKTQENNNNERERERERDAHIHSHTIVHAYIRNNAVLW